MISDKAEEANLCPKESHSQTASPRKESFCGKFCGKARTGDLLTMKLFNEIKAEGGGHDWD
jgi:hypothetical protein